MFVWMSGFFNKEKKGAPTKEANDGALVMPSLEVLLKNEYFLKNKFAPIEELILPLQPSISSFPLLSLVPPAPIMSNGNDSCDSFQEISSIHTSRSTTPIASADVRRPEESQHVEEGKSEEERLGKYKVLIDPITGERALYRRVDEQMTAVLDGDWVISFGDGRFLVIGAWPVLIASNILVLALGFYLHSPN